MTISSTNTVGCTSMYDGTEIYGMYVCPFTPLYFTAPYRAEIRFTVSPITVREGVDPELDVCIQSIVSGDVHPLEPSFPLSFIVDGASTAEGIYNTESNYA